MSISANKFVACTYELYVGDDNERELMEEATLERPLEYIHGMGMMLPEFEKNLFGLNAGDSFDFVLTSEQAYGDHSEENIMDLPKEIFTNEDGEFDSVRVVEGNTLPLYTPEGQTVMGTVVEIKDEVVVMDFNHPLAGETLHFVGKIVEEHEATSEEIEKFFGGQTGGGCGGGCGCGSSEGSSNGGGCCGGSCGC
ncbi:MAG: FKBP-type peptidyl-prolyl cis-trans isomerase [Porphyromonadaceae bacterium]|nr:FKBP-type peptidyl-prolyl cis-trans isomerase [Porphyromonadaceae bacterium]